MAVDCCVEIVNTQRTSTSQTISPNSSSSSLASSSSSSSSSSLTHRLRSREEIFRSICDSVPHRFRLHHFREENESYRYLVHSSEEICRARTKDMYHLLGMFAVFQGVIFSAVSQSTVLSCADAWSPVSLSLTTMIATVFAIRQKRASIHRLKDEILRNNARANAVYAKIEEMKVMGADYDFGEPETAMLTASCDESARGSSLCDVSLQVLLAVFSFFIITSCISVLCRECKCSSSKAR